MRKMIFLFWLLVASCKPIAESTRTADDVILFVQFRWYFTSVMECWLPQLKVTAICGEFLYAGDYYQIVYFAGEPFELWWEKTTNYGVFQQFHHVLLWRAGVSAW